MPAQNDPKEAHCHHGENHCTSTHNVRIFRNYFEY